MSRHIHVAIAGRGGGVTARGKAVAFDSLKDGEVVMNGCARAYVFVATSIEAVR